MKRHFFILFVLLLIFLDRSAAQVALEVKGQPFNNISRSEIEGYPYLENEWLNGTIILDNKTIDAKIKFNIYTNLVLFQDKNGQALELKNKFNGFTLTTVDNKISNLNPMVFVNGCPPIANRTESALYQLIESGKVALLKYYQKDLHEDRDYDSSVITTSYRNFRFYYILTANKIKEIQPGKKAFAKLFQNHSVEFDAYIKGNNVDFTSDTDLQNMFAWYNSLN
jgi:hypothetical protein